ncbi:hypothetical protein [Joostella sp. CR20]|uniref:hypothetical protein n=1 Tax=Joostella sp. CR20 TaxID=2804312 RepID=UPI00313D8F92
MPLLIKKYNTILLLILSSFLMFSCVKDVDFDQAETLTIEPVIDASLFYFELSASSVGNAPNNDITPLSVQDTTKMDVFSKPFFKENLQEAAFIFEFENTSQREFNAKIVFYDVAYNQLDEIDILINGPTISRTHRYAPSEIDKITNTEYLKLELELLPGTPLLDPNSTGALSLKSSGTFFMNIDAD